MTINEPRELYFVIQQPETPPDAMYFSEGWFVMTNFAGSGQSTGRTLVTSDGFQSFFTSQSHDVIYRVRTETAPPVMVNEASPSSLSAGQRGLTVTIRGAGFREGATVDFRAPRFGEPLLSGVDVREVRWIDAETLEVTVDVARSAQAGLLDVHVTNPEVLVPTRARLMRIESRVRGQ